MQTITDRIVERAKQLNLKQLDIMQATKAKRATVNKWFNHASEPSVKYLYDLSLILEVSIHWLVTGTEIMDFKIDNDKKIRKSPILTLEEVIDCHRYIITNYNVNREYEVFTENNLSEEVFWVRMDNDNSMLPIFSDKDLVLIDTKKQARTGNIVIVVIENDIKATLRKFRVCYDNKADKEYFELIAINDFYPTIDSRRNKFQIKGVAVKHERLLL